METVIVEPFRGCTLRISGEYYPGRRFRFDEPPEHPSFEIESIECDSKNLIDLLDWVSSNSDYLSTLEEMCIEEIENYIPDIEKD